LHNIVYVGVSTPLFFHYYKDINPDDMKLYIENDDGDFDEVEVEFEKVDKYYYRFKVLFDFTGKYYFKVTYQDKRIGGGFLNIQENLLNKIYQVEYGNWEIKDNKMYFYDVDGNTIATYELYNHKGEPTMENVFLRQRV